MKKLYLVVSIFLLVSLAWCALPVIGGWSWRVGSPTFLIQGLEGGDATVTVGIEGYFAGDPDAFDPSGIQIVLQTPRDTSVTVVEDDGFDISVDDDYGKERKAMLRVVVKEGWEDQHFLEKVTVGCEECVKVDTKKAEPSGWEFKLKFP